MIDVSPYRPTPRRLRFRVAYDQLRDGPPPVPGQRFEKDGFAIGEVVETTISDGVLTVVVGDVEPELADILLEMRAKYGLDVEAA